MASIYRRSGSGCLGTTNTPHHGSLSTRFRPVSNRPRNSSTSGAYLCSAAKAFSGSGLKVGRQSGFNSKRSSFEPPNSVVKPLFSGISGRPSSVGGSNKQKLYKNFTQNIMDKNYREYCVSKVIRFLADFKYPGNIIDQNLRQPTIQEFQRVFEFLYRFLDQKFAFDKDKRKCEEELPKIYKQLGYPFDLKKSSLQSLGASHSWPPVLAALNWLCDLIKYGLKTDILALLFPLSDDDFDRQESAAKKIFEYHTTCYALFNDNKDDYEAQFQHLKQEICGDSDMGKEELQVLINERNALEEQLKTLESSRPMDQKLHQDAQTIETDMAKLDAHIKQMVDYYEEQQRAAASLNDSEKALEAQLNELKSTIESKKQIIANQGLSTTEARQLVSCKTQLENELKTYQERIDTIQEEYYSAETSRTKCNEKINHAWLDVVQKAKSIGDSLLPKDGQQPEEFLNTSPFYPGFLDNAAEIKKLLLYARKLSHDEVNEAKNNLLTVKQTLQELEEDLNAKNAGTLHYQRQALVLKDELTALKEQHKSELLKLTNRRDDLQQRQLQLKRLDSMSCEEKQLELLKLEDQFRREKENIVKEEAEIVACVNQFIDQVLKAHEWLKEQDDGFHQFCQDLRSQIFAKYEYFDFELDQICQLAMQGLDDN